MVQKYASYGHFPEVRSGEFTSYRSIHYSKRFKKKKNGYDHANQREKFIKYVKTKLYSRGNQPNLRTLGPIESYFTTQSTVNVESHS